MATTRQHEGAVEYATPGVAGYAVMFLVACLIAPVVVIAAIVVTTGPPDPLGVVAIVVIGTAMAGVYGLPVAAVTTLVGHFALRRVWSQPVHVAFFGLVAGLLTWSMFSLMEGTWEAAFQVNALAAGIGAATGRMFVSTPGWRTRRLDSAGPSLR